LSSLFLIVVFVLDKDTFSGFCWRGVLLVGWFMGYAGNPFISTGEWWVCSNSTVGVVTPTPSFQLEIGGMVCGADADSIVK
jgi:hypothetical protein